MNQSNNNHRTMKNHLDQHLLSATSPQSNNQEIKNHIGTNYPKRNAIHIYSPLKDDSNALFELINLMVDVAYEDLSA